MTASDLREPGFRYVFDTLSVGQITCHPRDAKRVVDRRGPYAPPETVWEITVGGVVRRFWPEEIVRFEMEPVK